MYSLANFQATCRCNIVVYALVCVFLIFWLLNVLLIQADG